MKRENKAYSYKEQIIELELQEVRCSYHFMCIFGGVKVGTHVWFLFDPVGAKEEKRHQRWIAANSQTEGNDASPAGKGGCCSQKASSGMNHNHQVKWSTWSLTVIMSPHWAVVYLCLHQLDVELQSVVGLLEATLKERPPQITRELPAVLQVLMPLLKSPLAAPRIQQVFLDIGVCLVPKHLHYLGTQLVLELTNKNKLSI